MVRVPQRQPPALAPFGTSASGEPSAPPGHPGRGFSLAHVRRTSADRPPYVGTSCLTEPEPMAIRRIPEPLQTGRYHYFVRFFTQKGHTVGPGSPFRTASIGLGGP